MDQQPLKRVALFGLVSLVAVACGGGDDDAAQVVTPGPDAGSVQDAGGSSSSSGSPPADAGPHDAAAPDADAGAPVVDAGPACTTKPSADTTGVPAGVQLTVVEGDVTVTTDGTVIDAQDIHGFLIIEANGVTVKRSIVRGRATAETRPVLHVKSGVGTLVEDVEISVDAPSVDVDGIWGTSFVARRVHVHGGVDGIKVAKDSVVECSYVHDLKSFANDPNQNGGPTHNDAIQILSGTNIRLANNTLVAARSQNAALQVTQDFGVVSGLWALHNWVDGGGCTFNFSHKGEGGLSDVHTLDNRFGRNSYFGCPILKSTKTALDHAGDVYDDDDTEVPVQTHD